MKKKSLIITAVLVVVAILCFRQNLFGQGPVREILDQKIAAYEPSVEIFSAQTGVLIKRWTGVGIESQRNGYLILTNQFTRVAVYGTTGLVVVATEQHAPPRKISSAPRSPMNLRIEEAPKGE